MNTISKIIRKILPWRLYKLLANGWIVVPKYYSGIINEAESYFDLALEDSLQKDIMLIRKYGHILDKGLHRIDATPGHSHEIYRQLNVLVKKVQQTELATDPSFLWAVSKLKAYEKLQEHPEQFKPFSQEIPQSNISYEQLFELIKQRRSNRYFTDKVLSNETITKLKDTINWAANSCNKQSIRVFVSNDFSIAKSCLKCCAGGTGFGEYIPSFWCFTANVRGYVWPSEIYLPVIDTSLGVQNLFLAAQTLGVSGTILSWGQHTLEEEKRLRDILVIPRDYSIIFCAVMGYAKVNSVTPERKSKL